MSLPSHVTIRTEKSTMEHEQRTLEGFEPVWDTLHQATLNGLKRPAIRLQTKAGSPVLLSLVSTSWSRNPETVTVSNGKKHASRRHYGRITDRGVFTITPLLDSRIADAIVEVLLRYCEDPAGVASYYGQLTGNCCFCGRFLETKESVGAGYGPICAGRYGMPWGAETAALYEQRKEEALDSAFVDTSDMPTQRLSEDS